jgi:hypothetical protein
MEFGEVEYHRKQQNITPEWGGKELCAHNFEYNHEEHPDHQEHVVWFEDKASVEAKTWISRQYGAGVMLWHLGNENLEDGLPGPDGKVPGPGGVDPQIWEIFKPKNPTSP